MKNLLLVLFVMMTMAVNTDIQAQTTCTPAQIEACKKTCTPEQLAACQKKGVMKTASTETSATAVKVVNQAPEKSKNCAKSCAKGKVASTESTPVKLVGLDILSDDKKKTSCIKTCQKTAMKSEE